MSKTKEETSAVVTPDAVTPATETTPATKTLSDILSPKTKKVNGARTERYIGKKLPLPVVTEICTLLEIEDSGTDTDVFVGILTYAVECKRNELASKK